MEHWRLHHPMHWQRDIETTFFKCTRWQLEETLDPGICPYHYHCYSTYPGDYPSFIDILVFAFVAASFFSTVVLSLMEMLPGRRQSELERRRRYLLPSGPISLPVMLLILAKGHRINTLFPIISTGPAILQLIRASALAFESETDSDIRYLILESSTISGAIHAALFLDSVVLPYYTGLDALVSSTFSGECKSCICRKRTLVAGGTLILYRALSVTTTLVVCTLCSRIS